MALRVRSARDALRKALREFPPLGSKASEQGNRYPQLEDSALVVKEKFP